ncbi:hypothetical protein [Nocardia alni]|uniref:hypothetical protein n=1 Tax=Nocardia alni TaxID=2815723 RepID=UPI001C21EF90|nr:hypothetical protein [Nocardia alni]
MYGYLRLEFAGGQVPACEAQIRAFAEWEGFDLGMIFHERIHGDVALTALIAELRRSLPHHVAVPSMRHLIQPGMSRQAVEARLWREANAGVFVAADTDNRVEIPTAREYPRSGTVAVTRQQPLPRAGDMAEIHLAATTTAVSTAQLHARHTLSRWLLIELIAPTERLVTELVTDAVQATGSTDPHPKWSEITELKQLTVRVARTDQRVVIEVWDARQGGAHPLIDLPLSDHLVRLSHRYGRFIRSKADSSPGVSWAFQPPPSNGWG